MYLSPNQACQFQKDTIVDGVESHCEIQQDQLCTVKFSAQVINQDGEGCLYLIALS